jgi:hypothetical protein
MPAELPTRVKTRPVTGSGSVWIVGDYILSVMTVRVAATHVFVDAAKTSIAGTSPGRTMKVVSSGKLTYYPAA